MTYTLSNLRKEGSLTNPRTYLKRLKTNRMHCTSFPEHIHKLLALLLFEYEEVKDVNLTC